MSTPPQKARPAARSTTTRGWSSGNAESIEAGCSSPENTACSSGKKGRTWRAAPEKWELQQRRRQGGSAKGVQRQGGSVGSLLSPSSISPDSALKAAGRFSVTQSTAPAGVRSRSHWSVE